MKSGIYILAVISNFYKYRKYWIFIQNSMKSWIAEKFDSRFEKLMSFYVRKFCWKKNSGGICLRKIALKVVQLYIQSIGKVTGGFIFWITQPKWNQLSWNLVVLFITFWEIKFFFLNLHTVSLRYGSRKSVRGFDACSWS